MKHKILTWTEKVSNISVKTAVVKPLSLKLLDCNFQLS